MLRIITFFLTLSLSHLLVANEIRGKEGFWRITEENNIWWFVSPEGNKEFLTSVGNVRTEQKSRLENGKHYASNDNPQELSKKIKEYGFNCAGAWGEVHDMPYYEVLSIYAALPNISDDRWEKRAEIYIEGRVKKDDKNLVGYFLDNEIDWEIVDPWAEKYFKTCEILKKYDSNHLILGVRFNKLVSDKIIKLSKIFDANSVNNYRDDGKASSLFFSRIHNIAKTPIIISEFSFYSNENRSGNKNTMGFGGKVSTQNERAEKYSFFIEGISTCPYIIGTEWFQWADEPPDGRWDGEDCNYGLIDIFGKPYESLIKATQLSNPKSKLIHMKAIEDYNNPVWN